MSSSGRGVPGGSWSLHTSTSIPSYLCKPSCSSTTWLWYRESVSCEWTLHQSPSKSPGRKLRFITLQLCWHLTLQTSKSLASNTEVGFYLRVITGSYISFLSSKLYMIISWLDTVKNFFILRVAQPWDRSLRKLVDSWFLKDLRFI